MILEMLVVMLRIPSEMPCNNIKKRKDMRKKIPAYKALDKKSAKNFVCADKDNFVFTKNNSVGQSMDQDLDCWSDLFQHIRAIYYKYFRQKK